MAEESNTVEQEMQEHSHHYDPDRVPLKSILKHHASKYVSLCVLLCLVFLVFAS